MMLWTTSNAKIRQALPLYLNCELHLSNQIKHPSGFNSNSKFFFNARLTFFQCGTSHLGSMYLHMYCDTLLTLP